jgi:predicted nucleic acid-binding protein
MKLYIDTNVYLDYLLERKNKKGKDLSRPAFNVFKRAASCEFYVLVSNHLIQELRGIIDLNDLTMLMSFLKKKIIMISDETKGKGDELHAHLAIKHGADLIVTRNIKHFREFSIQSNTPEDL